jgi:hypothetical protein
MTVLVCWFLKRIVSWITFIRKIETYSKGREPQIKVPNFKEIKDNPNKYTLLFRSFEGQSFYLDKETKQVFLYLKYVNEVKLHGKLRVKIERLGKS